MTKQTTQSQRAARQAEHFAQDLRQAALRLRGHMEQNQQLSSQVVLEDIGQFTYQLYRTGAEEVPRLLRQSIHRLDNAAQDLKESSSASRFVQQAAGHLRDTIRSAAWDLNDVVERVVKQRREKDSK